MIRPRITERGLRLLLPICHEGGSEVPLEPWGQNLSAEDSLMVLQPLLPEPTLPTSAQGTETAKPIRRLKTSLSKLKQGNRVHDASLRYTVHSTPSLDLSKAMAGKLRRVLRQDSAGRSEGGFYLVSTKPPSGSHGFACWLR